MAALIRLSRCTRQLRYPLKLLERTIVKTNPPERIYSFSATPFVCLPRFNKITQRTYCEHSEIKQKIETEKPWYSPNYPASTFWKKLDYEKTFGRTDSVQLLKRVYETVHVGSGFSQVEFYRLMKYVEEKEMLTHDEVMLVITCLGYPNKEMSKSERLKWLEYFLNKMKASGVDFDIRCYNKLLLTMIENDKDFSPVEYLTELEQKGLAPDRVTFSRFLYQYCKKGDMKSANQILDHMKSCNMAITHKVYNSLITGHFLAGDPDSAMKLFHDTTKVGFEKDATSYFSVIVGYAWLGDLKTVQMLIAESEKNNIQLTDGAYATIIEKMSEKGLMKLAEFFIEKLQKRSSVFYNEVFDTLRVLMDHGNFDLAFKFYSGLAEPNGCLLYMIAVEKRMAPEMVVKYSQIMKVRGDSNSSLCSYLDICGKKMHLDQGLEIIPYMVKEGEELRSHDLYPFIRYSCIVEDIEDFKKILPYCFFDSQTMGYLVPALMQFVGLDKVRQYLKDHSKFTKTQQNTIFFLAVLETKGLEEAMKTLKTINSLTDLGNNSRDGLAHILEFHINQSNWTLILKLVSEINKKLPSFGRVDVSHSLFIALFKSNHSIPIIDIKSNLLELGLKIDRRTIIHAGLDKICTEKELEQISLKEPTLKEMSALNKNELQALEAALPHDFLVKVFLLQKLSIYDENFERLAEVLQDKRIEDKVVLEKLARFYTLKKQQPVTALALLNRLHKLDSNRTFDASFTVFYTANLLCKEGLQSEALKLFTDFAFDEKNIAYTVLKIDAPPPNIDYHQMPLYLFEMASTPENIKFAYNMLSAVINNGCLKPQKKTKILNIWKILDSFMDFVAKSADADEVCKALEYRKSNGYMFQDVALMGLFTPFIQKNDKAGLQKVLDKITNDFPEKLVLLSLAASFSETIQLDKAKKVLATPGLRVTPEDLNKILSEWSFKGKLKEVEQFTELIKNIPGLAKNKIVFHKFVAMTYNKSYSVDYCINFLEGQMEEEQVYLDMEMLQVYGKYLQLHNRAVPFKMENENYVRNRNIPATKTVHPKINKSVATTKTDKLKVKKNQESENSITSSASVEQKQKTRETGKKADVVQTVTVANEIQ